MKNLLAALIICSQVCSAKPDVTFVGQVKYGDGLFRISIGLMDSLSEYLDINFIRSGMVDLESVPEHVKAIIEEPDKTPGPVAMLLESPWHAWGSPADLVPNSEIKLAYSMIEGSAIPPQWVRIFNEKFDAVVVPDDFLVQSYMRSGVKIPIFVIPCGLYLDDFLHDIPKRSRNRVFTFGSSAFFAPGKNHELVLEAFAKLYAHRDDVQLKLHGRFGEPEKLMKRIRDLKLDNVELICRNLSNKEYLDFFKSLDCYVLLSKGEGFSITPREALALGIPCILSDNTAQSTICRTKLVRAVPSLIKEPAYYFPLAGTYGSKYNATIEDACGAMSDVLENYQKYKILAHKGRKWVKQYQYDHVKYKFLTMLKPQKVEMGKKNIVLHDVLYTNSKRLFDKYTKLIKSNARNVKI